MSASPNTVAAGLTRVSIVPDWTDPSRKRWQVLVALANHLEAKTCASEQDARMSAFILTGVGDFLSWLTWVEGIGFSR